MKKDGKKGRWLLIPVIGGLLWYTFKKSKEAKTWGKAAKSHTQRAEIIKRDIKAREREIKARNEEIEALKRIKQLAKEAEDL